jgi:hypothetical protein
MFNSILVTLNASRVFASSSKTRRFSSALSIEAVLLFRELIALDTTEEGLK